MKTIGALYKFKGNEGGSYSILEGKVGKLTGTQISAIVGRNPWQTPFSVATRLLRLYDEDIDDEPKIRAGKVLEPVVLNYCKTHGLPLKRADEIFPERTGSHEDWEQDFNDDVFGGHIDALAEDGAIVECKTTSSPEVWMRGEIPEHYWLQASLYAKFFKTDKIHFTVGFLSPEDVANPYKFVPTADNVKVYTVGLHPKIDEYMEQARQWYGDYILKNKTPVPDMKNPIDARIVQVLDVQIMNAVEIGKLMDEYESLLEKIDSLNELKKKADNIKDGLMVYMKTHNLNLRTATATYKYVETSRTVADTDSMKKDGIYDKYTKESVSKSIKRVKG